MSTRNKFRKPTDRTSPTEKDPGYAIYHSLARVVNEAPKPQLLWLDNESDEEQRRAAAPGLAWGWLQRTLRSGEAAIKLEKSGYGSESAPLLRSALEHAMRVGVAVVGLDPAAGLVQRIAQVTQCSRSMTPFQMLARCCSCVEATG
jgi:hypothetical protein